MIYGESQGTGYPISEILQGIAYIIADENELFGTRAKGNYLSLIRNHVNQNPMLSVEVRQPDLLTPLIIDSNGRGIMVGAVNPHVYERLVSVDSKNEYKLIVRKITEEDLRDG